MPSSCSEHATEIKLLQEHIHDAIGQIVYDRRGGRPMVLPVVIEVSRGWLGQRHRGERGQRPHRRAALRQLRACEVAALAFCRLLERWGRAMPCPRPWGAPGRAAAGSGLVETALAGLEQPLSRYLLELEPELAEGRSVVCGPGSGELVEWRPVLDRAGVRACPTASRPSTSSSPSWCARFRACPRRRAWTLCRTGRPCGPASSTSATPPARLDRRGSAALAA